MTPSSPDEALHFRGKTLTPESPRPLHVAEPAKIPVLQNQMDPVFNDTSTYEKSEAFLGNSSQEHPNDSTSLHGQYAGPGEVRGTTGSVQVPEQPPPRRPPNTQGSFHSDSSQVEDGSMNKIAHALSATATTAQASFASDQPAPPMAGGTSSAAQDAPTDSSLTTLPPSDPASLLAPPPPPRCPSLFLPCRSRHPQCERDSQSKADDNTGEDGVDFQNLLDNLPPSSTAPSAPAVSETAPLSTDVSALPQAGTDDEALQSSLGLPPRPPPQEKPSIHPNYNASDDIRSYHQLPPNTSNAQPSPSSTYTAQQSNYQSNLGLPSLAAAGAPGTSSGASALPPPPVPSFQQSTSTTTSETQDSPGPVNNRKAGGERVVARQSKGSDEDTPWGPEVQKKYDEFLHDERIYVTEGLWDRFPPGSRLFVGNLPTERVTKRDLFHIFHKFGKLAQISIKQAYGFIQFLDSSACKQALDAEQGAVVRGRKVHLEISKPQRSTRPGAAPAEPSRAPPPRRSRSPEFSRSGPSGSRSARAPADRYDRPYESGRVPFSDFRDEPGHRRRDDYRPPPPPRSPSPRAFRARDGYRSRDRTPERYERRERRRSRSPYTRDRRYRTPSPRGRGSYEGDADLPVPRRAPRDVPEVQILVLEELDRNFIFFVENSFRNRGLRVDVLVLGLRIPLNAAVQRQIQEGVLAVVRLSRPSQFSRKIPLQVFDRSGGADNVRSNEYPDVEPSIAAEIVFHAQSVQRGAPPAPFPPNPAFGVPPLPAPAATVPPQAPLPTVANQPNIANLITSLDGPTLQSLLGVLQQRPPAVPTAQQPFPSASTPHGAADLASLLNAATRQPVAANPQQPLAPPPFPLQAPNAPLVSDPNLISLLAKGLGGQQPQNQAAVGPHVQNIMNQLGKWKQ
ncbi:arginine/serine-rich splicing factor [Aspergillus luchuensis IFO 4308]|nr:arginine/serine-rich splicing factor [Aspergillus luchuensis IFO 4308]